MPGGTGTGDTGGIGDTGDKDRHEHRGQRHGTLDTDKCNPEHPSNSDTRKELLRSRSRTAVPLS